MPRQNKSQTELTAAKAKAPPIFRVLVVDPEPQAGKTLDHAIGGEGMQIVKVSNIAEANTTLDNERIDLAMIDPTLPDGCGMTLAGDIRRRFPSTQTIVITNEPSLERAIDAIRAGAADLLSKPLDIKELNHRVVAALQRRNHDAVQTKRIKRLRRICKKLTNAHEDVTRQVDVLCNDLVTAYQELAEQMNKVSDTREFTQMLKNELDIEQVLRKTLEYLLQKAGPTNAAVFLPTTADEFTLGGYVNYDCSGDSADMMLQHLASVVAPRLREETEVIHLTDNQQLEHWFDADWNYLADSHLVGITCQHKDEPLAVLVLFRDGGEPFGDDMPAHLESIAPLLAEYLAKVVRIHHRAMPGLHEDTEGDAIWS